MTTTNETPAKSALLEALNGVEFLPEKFDLADIRKDPVEPDVARDLLLEKYPWAGEWQIRISKGHVPVVSRFLKDVEEILGPDQKPEYMRIVEKPVNDNDFGATFSRTIQIAIHPSNRMSSRYGALKDSAANAISHANTSCCICAEYLEFRFVLADIKGTCKRLFTFLPKDTLPIDKNGDVHSRMPVCTKCTTLILWPETVNPNAEPITAEADSNSPSITLYEEEQINNLSAGLESAGKDKKSRFTALVARVKKRTPQRRLATIPEDWQTYCNNLEASFPNFVEVIGFVRNQLALSSVGDGVLRMPPLLLVGEPGIGKTEIALTIASYFKTKLEILNMASAQTGALLTGSETYWGNSEPGLLFNSLMFGETANPIILLDEIDKIIDPLYHNPLAGLNQLLEPRQARQFQDLSVPELTLDASHVIWIATANSTQSIEKQILDRFTIFSIDKPSAAQMKLIARNQYDRFISEHPAGSYFDAMPSKEVIDEITRHHPRKVRKLLSTAFGMAAYQERKHLLVTDIQDSDYDKSSSSIGFTAELR